MAGSNSNEEVRPLAHFAPSLWGNYFHSFNLNEMEKETYARQVEVKKEKVKEMLSVSRCNPTESVKLIDLLTRLGVFYHFESQIKERLEDIFSRQNFIDDISDCDLNAISIVFRIFRQHGYYISPNVFNKFKNSKGAFKEELAQDVKGMLSLYEASHLRMHGEDILDEVLEFTTIHLKGLSTQLSHPLAKQVGYCLEYPIQKHIPRVEARHFISTYEQDDSHSDTLLELAKADFNLVQLLHRQELSDITSWHKELAEKLPYARDRVVELYFWMMAVYFEPHYSRARTIVTKLIAIYSIFDDTYDSYATSAELKIFTNALKRWDMTAVDDLPDYMKIIYRALLNFFDELDQEMSKQERSHVVEYAKQQVIELAYAYHQETKWHKENYVPKFDEYITVALRSAVSQAIISASFIGMEKFAGKEATEWLDTYPKIVRASEAIGRLRNDIVSHKFERGRSHLGSAVEYYMKEYGVGEEEAVKGLNKMVENAWKDTNEACMRPTVVPMHILLRVVNLSRCCHFVYKHTDGYTNAEALKDTIASLYIEKMSI